MRTKFPTKSMTGAAQLRAACALACTLAAANAVYAQNPVASQQATEFAGVASSIVVFWESGFPAIDTAAPTREQLSSLLPGANFSDTAQLPGFLRAAEMQTLVLPFGSAFPEEDWPAIHAFLAAGGNLLVVGGRPFTRAVYKDRETWRARVPNQSFARSLFLNAYDETPGSAQAPFTPNEDFASLKLPEFSWRRAWSATVRLSDENLYPREGSAGSIDARLDTLVWGAAEGHRLAAPIIQIDHLHNQFAGGRWVLLPVELSADFWSSEAARRLVPLLASRASQGAEEFRVRPESIIALPRQNVSLEIYWNRLHGKRLLQPVEIHQTDCGGLPQETSSLLGLAMFGGSLERARSEETQARMHPEFPVQEELSVMAPQSGFCRLTSTLRDENGDHVAHAGFWVRGSPLRSGPKTGVAENFFTLDGNPMLIAGTTYMASDVQRQFLALPNPYVWDRDMAEIEAAGLNTIRTGMWTGWDQAMRQPGEMNEETLRALEAFFLTARAHHLAVQFTFFAFMPEVFGGTNPYLDPEAIRRQKEFITAIVRRFRDFDFISWDLINEPSFSNPRKAWQTRPSGDPFELRAWNDWLEKKYPSRSALAEAWRSITVADTESVPLPSEEEFSGAAAYEAWPADNSLRAMDYLFFAQDAFRNWAMQMRDAIRGTGSTQFVTVGEDEGGGNDRPSPAFFADAVDFTTTHSWWASDALLWDSLVAKVSGKPMLVQETGVSREVRVDGDPHRTLAAETALFKRKLAIAAGTGAGAIEWLWNVNAYMRDDREATIGAVRADGTEKPEAAALRQLGKFATAAGPHLQGAVPPLVTIVTSQTLQFSPLQKLALEAQQKSVRAMNVNCGVAANIITENNFPHDLLKNPRPKLVILPSPQALSDGAWAALLQYVNGGGTLLVTGSVERDAHWRVTHRFAQLGAEAVPQPILAHDADQQLGSATAHLAFSADAQSAVERLQFSDGKDFRILQHGAGRIFVTSNPVELAEGDSAATQLYDWALKQAGVRPEFEGNVPAGVMVRPVEFADSVLYLIVSETAGDAHLNLRDRTSHGKIEMDLPSGAADLLLFNKKDGAIISRLAR
jgi:hypothetical protein